MGKTTLMRMVRDRLVAQHGRDKKRRSFPIVWFNAWSFDQEESVWAALTLAILKEVRSNLTLRQRMRLWLILSLQQLRHTDAGLLAMRAFRAACFVLTTIVFAGIVYYIFNTGLIKSLPETIQNLLTIGLAVGGFGFILSIVFAGIQLLNTILKAFDIKVVDLIHEPSDQKRINFLSEFHADFQEIAKLATENGKWPIVVFIDDLERAAPPRPAEIVEAINLFLGSQFTVFVIGMDARMVAGSIEAKYAALKEYLADEDEPGGLRLGQRFLDKIVQVNFRIPRSDSQAFGGFIRRNVSGDDDSPQPLTSDKVTQTEELIRAEQRTGKSLDQAAQVVTTQGHKIDEAVIRKAKQEIFAKSLDDSPEFRDAVNGAARYLGFNPRKFKRFLNNFRLLALIYNRRGLFDRGTHQLTLLANWTIISTRWPDVNDALDADPKFLLLLVDAYKARDIVHQRQDHGESDEIGAYAEKKHLDSYVANRYIKRLIDSDDLKSLLEKMKPQEIELVSQYANYRSITP
jgi:KAP family P-loop domain